MQISPDNKINHQNHWIDIHKEEALILKSAKLIYTHCELLCIRRIL